MSGGGRRVVVVPCSGIGKAFGTVAREAGYDLADDLRPESTRLVALSRLVLGDGDARATVAASPVITIDGCRLDCATKMVRESGGEVACRVSVQEVFRRHRDLKPEGIARLNPEGQRLARMLAEELLPQVDALSKTVAEAGVAAGMEAGAQASAGTGADAADAAAKSDDRTVDTAAGDAEPAARGDDHA